MPFCSILECLEKDVYYYYLYTRKLTDSIQTKFSNLQQIRDYNLDKMDDTSVDEPIVVKADSLPFLSH